MSTTNRDIDESLYSRQLYVLGHEGQRRMAGSSILIVGCDGLGVEIAKNVILAGVKSVTVFDPVAASYFDLASQFYLKEDHVRSGAKRAEACIDQLAELNPYVAVTALPSHLSWSKIEELLYGGVFTVVALANQPMDVQTKLCEVAHEKGIYVINSTVKGVCGSVFCDFGRDFVVTDGDGEQPVSSLLAGVLLNLESASAVVTTLEETRHGLVSGDRVLISDIAGSIGDILNNREFFVTVKDLYSFEISLEDCLSEISAYTSSGKKLLYDRGGYVNQIKQPKAYSFERFSESMNDPKAFLGHEYKLYRAGLMHLLFRGYHAYEAKYRSAPVPGDLSHAQAFHDTVLELLAGNDLPYTSISEVRDNEKLIKQFAMTCMGSLSPVCAFFGGIAGQEVLKACSGKFTPIRQWFYYDFLDALPDHILPMHEVQCRHDRYDGQVAVFGSTIQSQLQALNIFLVGAGAIGCEMIKNFSLMGVGCGNAGTSPSSDKASQGTIFITDPDQIEKSNLSRQFLFRNKDIHTPKSITAAKAATSMNSHVNIIALEQKVCAETESYFNDDFYENIDMICTALDNIEARLYMDQKALFYHKPMLESGTLGTKGHTQLVVPRLTEHYGATRDPPEKSIPMCTLKFFPNQIEHTIQWAREWFEEVYHQAPSDALGYLNDPHYLSSLASQQNVKLDILKHIDDTLRNQPRDMVDCILWARLRFEELFSHQIQQLLYNLPLNKVTAEGTPFWSGAKKPPSPISFDPDDSQHMEFIISAAIMRGKVYNLSTSSIDSMPLDHWKHVAMSVAIDPFKPQDNVKIATTEEEAKNNGNNKLAPSFSGANIDQICDDIVKNLPSPAAIQSTIAVSSIDFDKDIDDHIKVIASLANLRARNYKIPEVDLHKARGIAGKIIPAIATTTALVTGAICMELYKLLLKKSVDHYCNSFYNLAIPLFTSMEPEPPKFNKSMIKGEEWKWNQWDRIDVSDPSMTLKQLIDYLDETYDVDLVMLSAGVTIVFSAMIPAKKANERKAMKVKELVESVCKKAIPSSQKYLILEIMAENKDGDEVELPYIRFALY